MKSLLVAITAIVSVLYILNPTAGILEFIPDNIPVFGNIDEAAAMTILLACARYFGIDLSKFFGSLVKSRKKDDIVDVGKGER
ncbi:MAG: DUF1232 domain-containing protein [Akkermansiaceae bacterium]